MSAEEGFVAAGEEEENGDERDRGPNEEFGCLGREERGDGVRGVGVEVLFAAGAAGELVERWVDLGAAAAFGAGDIEAGAGSILVKTMGWGPPRLNCRRS